jgi:hypothetical protein
VRQVATGESTPTKRPRKRKAAPPTIAAEDVAASMSSAHKQALATGREESRAVRNYLEALETSRPKRGRKRTPETIQKRIEAIDSSLADASPLDRVLLVQERLNLTSELGASSPEVDLGGLEEKFVEVVASYSTRKGLTYAAWRDAGVDAAILKRAGVPRTRS